MTPLRLFIITASFGIWCALVSAVLILCQRVELANGFIAAGMVGGAAGFLTAGYQLWRIKKP